MSDENDDAIAKVKASIDAFLHQLGDDPALARDAPRDKTLAWAREIVAAVMDGRYSSVTFKMDNGVLAADVSMAVPKAIERIELPSYVTLALISKID